MNNNYPASSPIRRLLVANRGEIAIRIIKTARRMGIQTIGIVTVSEPETDADEAAFLDGTTLAETYLNGAAIIKLALEYHAEAIHPGYGFLSENSGFASLVQDAGLIFIGPSPDAIHQMGNKTNARKLAASLNIPLTQAIYGSVEEILQHKEILSSPLLIKAAAGGGGKGMQLVRQMDELEEKLTQTAREAKNYFGDGTIYVEQYIENPRHIEVQVLGDLYGNRIHLFERECSIQRRYQKIIEEAPSPFADHTIREALTSDALRLCAAIEYYNAGTVEFLVDQSGNHYFLEMNTRLQVEHPVTEQITGIDLVEQQILIASGLPLTYKQSDIRINGHAIEYRIYAEDPLNNFRPAPGQIHEVHWPDEALARTDTWIAKPVEIQSDFDPMMAKIVVHGPNRQAALLKSISALEQIRITGSTNNIGYLKAILRNDLFRTGEINTGFCDNFIFNTSPKPPAEAVASAILIWQFNRKQNGSTIWHQIGFSPMAQEASYLVNENRVLIQWEHLSHSGTITFNINKNETHHTSKIRFNQGIVSFQTNGISHLFRWIELPSGNLFLECESHQFTVTPMHQLPTEVDFTSTQNTSLNGNGHHLKAPIPGRIIEIKVQEGDKIKIGDPLVILEAMKMENRLNAMREGTIRRIFSLPGQQVKANEILIDIE